LRGPLVHRADQAVFHHPGLEKRPDEFEHTFVGHPRGHACHQVRDEVSADYNDMIYAASPGEIEQRRRAFLCSGLWTKCGPNSRRCAAELYRNGNLHIVFKRPDIVAKANKIVADFYGETLADARRTA